MSLEYHSKQKQNFNRMFFFSELNMSELSSLPSNHLYSILYPQHMNFQNTYFLLLLTSAQINVNFYLYFGFWFCMGG